MPNAAVIRCDYRDADGQRRPLERAPVAVITHRRGSDLPCQRHIMCRGHAAALLRAGHPKPDGQATANCRWEPVPV